MIVISAGLLVLLLTQTTLTQLRSALTGARPSWLVVAVVSGLAVSMLRSLRLATFFPPGQQWLQLYGVLCLMRPLKLLLPFQSGELALLATLKKYRLVPSMTEAAPAWLLTKAGDLVAVALGLTVVLGSFPLGHGFEVARWLLLIAAAVVVAVVVGLRRPLKMRPGWGWLADRLDKLRMGVERARKGRLMLLTLVLSLLVWISMTIMATSAQLAFTTPLELLACVAVAVTVMAAGALPIHAPLGIGTDEAIWTAAMVLLGVALEQAVALAIAVRLVLLAILLCDGLIGMLVLWGLSLLRRQSTGAGQE
jgi:uncharacterized membrane protein YbhN (UPF0104 family)